MFAIEAMLVFAAKVSNDWFERWCHAKYGRGSPAEDALQKAERANTVLLEEPTETQPANTWLQDWYKALGQPYTLQVGRKQMKLSGLGIRPIWESQSCFCYP